MDQETPIQQPVVQEPQQVQPAPAPTPAPPPSPRSMTPFIIGAVVFLIILVAVVIGVSRMKPQQVVVTPTPTPTSMPTPTPIRQPSELSTKPEFKQLEAAVATLSAAIAAYSPQDPSLTPPTLILPLGFKR